MTELLKDFEKEFEKLRKDLKLKVSLDELDNIFYVRDLIMKDGFISTHLSKQISRRIVDIYSSWTNYLHGIIMANPSSLISITESQVFSEEEKEKMMKLIEKIMILSTEFNLMVIGNDKDAGKFIDDSYTLWKNECAPELIKIMKKTGQRWEERLKSKPQKEDNDFKNMYG